MPYLVVLALSVLVGGAVYLATVRRSERDVATLGFGGEDDPADAGAAPPAGPGYAYLRVSTDSPSIADRLQGLLGAVILVAIGAAVLAFAIYQAGHFINLVIESFLDS